MSRLHEIATQLYNKTGVVLGRGGLVARVYTCDTLASNSSLECSVTCLRLPWGSSQCWGPGIVTHMETEALPVYSCCQCGCVHPSPHLTHLPLSSGAPSLTSLPRPPLQAGWPRRGPGSSRAHLYTCIMALLIKWPCHSPHTACLPQITPPHFSPVCFLYCAGWQWDPLHVY